MSTRTDHLALLRELEGLLKAPESPAEWLAWLEEHHFGSRDDDGEACYPEPTAVHEAFAARWPQFAKRVRDDAAKTFLNRLRTAPDAEWPIVAIFARPNDGTYPTPAMHALHALRCRVSNAWPPNEKPFVAQSVALTLDRSVMALVFSRQKLGPDAALHAAQQEMRDAEQTDAVSET